MLLPNFPTEKTYKDWFLDNMDFKKLNKIN